MELSGLLRHGEHFYEERDMDGRHRSSLEAQVAVTTTIQTSSDDTLLLPKGNVGHGLRRHEKQRLLAGWRVGALVSFIGAASVCLFNLVITIWVWKGPNYEMNGSIGTLFRGSCARVRSLNVWVHLLVNVLSTLLLCASNYCMQVLSAPNREELSKAHAQRTWLHIGVPSLHNLVRIRRDRSVLWVLLMISSLPLHLLFNSVVFTNLQANKYGVIPTTEDWLHGGTYNTSGFLGLNRTATSSIVYAIDTYRPNLTDVVLLRDEVNNSKYRNISKYSNVSTAECFEEYGRQYLSAVGNLYLIQEGGTVWRNQSVWFLKRNSTGHFIWESDGLSHNGYTRQIPTDKFPYQSSPDFYPSYGWRCPSHNLTNCDIGNEFEIPRDRSEWEPFERPVKYCMVEQVQEICQLQFSFPIALIVVTSNFVKVAVIGLIFFKFRNHAALVTLGDVVASFLDEPDQETRGCCLASKYHVEARWNKRDPFSSVGKVGLDTRPVKFKQDPYKWANAPGYGSWFVTYIFYFAAVLFGGVCIGWSMGGMPSNPTALWKIGFGTVNGNNLIKTSTSLMGGVLLANAPQAVLSYLYLAFNVLYTNMFIGREWASYLNERKPLRVTSPVGQQRETYWLNVPFRYAIPMTILSGIFHWLASQSFFMVQITVTNSHTREVTPTDQISTCGYSPFAIILTTVTGTVIAIGGIAIGTIKYPAGMPLAGSCSAAISAACHPPPEDVDASLLPLQWGAVTHEEERSDGGEPVGHCTFSSLPVEYPIPGRLYA